MNKLCLTGIQKAGEHINRYLYHSLHSKQLCNFCFRQLSADDAQLADHSGRAHAHIVLLGHIVEVDPAAILAGNDALGPQHHAKAAGVQAVQCRFNLANRELLGGLRAPGSEHLIGVVIVVIVAAATMLAVLMMVRMFMLMVAMAAAAAAAFLMMMVLMLILMVTVAAMMLIMFMLMVTVTAMMLLMFMFMLMVTMTAMMLLIVVMVFMIVMAAAAMTLFVVMVVVVMMVMVLLLQLSQRGRQAGLALHRLQQLRTGQFVPRCNNQRCLSIVLS